MKKDGRGEERGEDGVGMGEGRRRLSMHMTNCHLG